MIVGKRICLRPLRPDDWELFERWSHNRESIWGAYQRFQLDNLPQLHLAFQETGLLGRNGGFLMIEVLEDGQVIGFVRYTLLQFPDADLPYPEIGYGIAELGARGKGYAQEAVGLLVDYLLAGYPCPRIAAFVEAGNDPSRRVLEKNGFQCEGTLRRATFRDGAYRDIAVYARLREEKAT